MYQCFSELLSGCSTASITRLISMLNTRDQKEYLILKEKCYKATIKSNTALKLIKEWAVLRNTELEENWKNITDKAAINKIEPLH